MSTHVQGRKAPRVSVAIPAYNAAPWIEEAVTSVLGQSMPDFELIVVDDASTDATAEIVRAVADPRIRLVRNDVNLGQNASWNHAISLCRAPLVKFLCADDRLREDCLERMLNVAERSERVGMVFSLRLIEPEPGDENGRRWAAAHARTHEYFGPLDEVNRGRRLFDVYFEACFPDNWIGEPTNVMLRRDALDSLGGFHPHIKQALDMDLWVRAMFHYDVGFVDEPLAVYRLVQSSVSRTTAQAGSRWLDRLWFLESLLADDEIRSAYPQLRAMVRGERLRASTRLVRRLARMSHPRDRLREARVYLGYTL